MGLLLLPMRPSMYWGCFLLTIKVYKARTTNRFGFAGAVTFINLDTSSSPTLTTLNCTFCHIVISLLWFTVFNATVMTVCGVRTIVVHITIINPEMKSI